MKGDRVERIGVVGAGTMGAGIAQIAALGGYETRLHDPVPAALENGVQRLRTALVKGTTKGLWNEDDAEAASDRVGAARNLGDLCECELVVEAAPEDLSVKRELFNGLAEVCGTNAILATNTSSLPVTAIAAGVPNPERVLGMHFFNPPALMKLVEVVATDSSSEGALGEAVAVARAMDRIPIVARDAPGFVANRLARPFSLEAMRMLADDVADPATIDRIVRLGGGFRMGPFELVDLIGLDVNLAVAHSLYEQAGKPARWRPSEFQKQLVAEGHLGRKTKRGFHDYPLDSNRYAPPEVKIGELELGVKAPTLNAAELERIDPAAPEVLSRLIAQIANEAAFALDEEIATAEDLNRAMRLGFNWPLGPLEFTSLIGAGKAVALLEGLRDRLGDAYEPCPRLVAAARREEGE